MSKLDPPSLKRQLCEECLGIRGNSIDLKIPIMNLAVKFYRLPELMSEENPYLQPANEPHLSGFSTF